MKKPEQSRLSFFSDQFFNFFRTDYGHLVIGVIIASCAWVLIEIDKDYTTFSYVNFKLKAPEGYVLSKDSFEEIPVRLQGNGFDLIRALSKLEKEIEIEIKTVDKKFSLGRSKLNELLRKKIQSNVLVDANLDSQIDLFVDKNVSKKLKINPRVSFEIAPGFILLEKPRLSNDSVVVIGPEMVLDTLNQIDSEHLDLGSIDKNTSEPLKLNLDNIPIQVNDQNILLALNIDKITEKKIVVDLHEALSVIADSVLIVPNQLNVDLGVPLSMYDEIGGQDLKVEQIKGPDSLENKTFSLQVNVKDPRIVIYNFGPKEVEIYKYNKN